MRSIEVNMGFIGDRNGFGLYANHSARASVGWAKGSTPCVCVWSVGDGRHLRVEMSSDAEGDLAVGRSPLPSPWGYGRRRRRQGAMGRGVWAAPGGGGREENSDSVANLFPISPLIQIRSTIRASHTKGGSGSESHKRAPLIPDVFKMRERVRCLMASMLSNGQ